MVLATYLTAMMHTSSFGEVSWRPMKYLLLFLASEAFQRVNAEMNPPDFLKCDAAYGRGLRGDTCQRALNKVIDQPFGLQKFVQHKTGAAGSALEVPVIFKDDDSTF